MEAGLFSSEDHEHTGTDVCVALFSIIGVSLARCAPVRGTLTGPEALRRTTATGHTAHTPARPFLPDTVNCS